MAIDFLNHLPTVSLETRRRIIGKPALDLAIDRDPVVVPEGDQFTQPQGPRQ